MELVLVVFQLKSSLKVCGNFEAQVCSFESMASETSGDVFPYSKVEVIFVKDLLYAGLGLLSAAGAAYFMYSYISQKASEATSTSFIIALVFAILALVFGTLFFLGKVNKQEEIHITE